MYKIIPFYWDSSMFTYKGIKDGVTMVLNCFFKVWQYMCSPFIEEYNYITSGGNYYPYWSVLLIPIGIGLCFCSVALVKTLIRKLLERG